MNVCPFGPEWDSLVDHPEIGTFEAMRDFKEYGDIRTPEQVLKKLKDRRIDIFVEDREQAVRDIPFNKRFYSGLSLSDSIAEDLLLNSNSVQRDQANVYSVVLTQTSNKIKQDAQRYTAGQRLVDKINGKYGLSTEPIAFLDKSDGRVTIRIQSKAWHTNLYAKNLMEWESTVSYNRPEETLNFNDTEVARSTEIATKLAQGLAQQFGIQWQMIDQDAAKEITKDSKTPWSGEPAFFIGDQIYFVNGAINVNNVLHEYGHPLIRSIATTNKGLFDKLYVDMFSTQEGQDVVESVRQRYPELMDSDDLFKEEVLVHALQTAARLKFDKVQQTTGFSKIINNILYAIKQLLRRTFGQKVDVAKMDETTTLNQLAQMMIEGKGFKIDVESVSQEDVASYSRDFAQYITDLNKIDKPELQKITNDFFDRVSKHIKKVKENDAYSEMLDVLVNEYKTGDLQKMRENLKPYQTKILEQMNQLEDQVEQDRAHTEALLNTLFRLQNTTEKIRQHLIDLSKDVDNQDNLQRAFYYKELLSSWGDFINGVDAELSKTFVDVSSPLSKLVGGIVQSIKRGGDVVNSIYEKGAGDLLTGVLADSQKAIDDKYQTMLADLQRRNAPQKIIDRLQKEYDDAKITPEKIRQALKGELKDANALNSFFEGYGYNTDPVVGGLAKYVKDNMTDVLVKSQANFNAFADEIKPLLDANGYNPNNVGELGEKLGYKDKVGYVDNGEFKTREVWRFLNEFKGHDLVEDEYRFRIRMAGEKFAQTNTEEDKQALYDLQSEWRKHRKDYWHEEYKPEFYTRYDILERDEIGREAAAEQDAIYDEMRRLTESPTSAEDDLLVAEQLEELQRQLRRLTDVNDAGGRPKTGRDLEIAQRLKEFREASIPFYDSVEIPGAFAAALRDYEQKLIGEGKVRGSASFNLLRDSWLERNMRVVPKQEFWDDMTAISERIKEILATIPQQQRVELEISESFEKIREMLTGNRDEDGQPVGGEMTKERLQIVKEAQERIIKAQDNLTKMSGLSRVEQFQLDRIYERLAEGQASKEDKYHLSKLMERKSQLALDKFQRAELRGLFAQLEMIRRKDATDSYVDVMNNWLSTLETDDLYEKYKINGVTKDMAYILLNERNLEPLFMQSEEFETWFKANHIHRDSIDQETGEETKKWERINAWNVIRPNENHYYEKTVVRDEVGNDVELLGLPAMKYSKRIVKDEFRTEKVVGRTVDNRGNWLPKSLADGAKDDRYINQDYFKMQQENPKLFQLLEVMKRHHLAYQQGIPKKSRLYLDMPRYRKGGIERLQSQNLLQRLLEAIRTFWAKVRDGYDRGLNYKDDFQLVKLDMFDDEVTGIPMAGISNLEADEVSTDIAQTMMRYMLAAERNKKLTEINPMVRAIQQTVNDKRNMPFVEKSLNNRTMVFLNKRKDKYVRAQAVNNFIEREFEGQVNTGIFSDNPAVQNLSNAIFKQASFAYLAMNIPSALKNSIGMKFQGMLEAVAGQYMSKQSFIKGEVWATNATAKISLEVYKQGSKSHDLQLIEIFDAEAGRFEHKMGEALSRTPGKDTINILERLSDFRKWTQLQASLQIFAGMMLHEKVLQNGKYISYMDAWETKDGKIQLKEGIDPSYGIVYENGEMKVGDKFKAKKNQIQMVMSNMNGAMSTFEQPEANRYLMYRFISYLRRWMTSLITNRLAYSGSLWRGSSRGRVNYQLQSTHEGFYITTIKAITKALQSGGKSLAYMKGDEKRSFLKLGTEVAATVILSMLLPLLFGFDSDDDDRFKKLRAKSGALPLPFVPDDPDRPFAFGGWLSNQALLLTMQVRAENAQFLPYPGNLSGYTSILDAQSIAFNPTIKSGVKIMQDLTYMASGDDRAYYKRDVGAYDWQKQGSSKFLSHLMAAFGLTGSSIDAAEATKRFQANQDRVK